MRTLWRLSPSHSLVLALLALAPSIAVAGTPAEIPPSLRSAIEKASLLTRETKLTASDASRDDNFGLSVAVSGDTAVIGAPLDAHAGSSSGSAYVFVRSAGVWSQQQKLTASDAAAGNQFGISVAVSGDTAVIGSHGDSDAGSFSGSAYAFVRSGGVWSQQQKLMASDAAAFHNFGFSVAVSGDTAVVGAIGDSDAGFLSGAAYVFARSGSVWSQQQKLTASDAATGDEFGYSVAVSADTAVVGAPFDSDAGSDSGAAYVFVRSESVWSQQQVLTALDAAAGDNFGRSVAVSADTAVVGTPFDSAAGAGSGAAYVFERSGGVWSQQQKLTASDAAAHHSFGYSVAISADTLAVGAPGSSDVGTNSGAAYVYEPGSTARVWVGLKNSDDVGIRFDLRADVYVNGSLVGSGQLDSVAGGSSGFNNAKLDSIPLTLTAPVAVSTGDMLSIEILVRNACSGSGKNSGTARLWFNGQPVDSGTTRDAGTRFDATIAGTNRDYFLRGASALNTTAGTSRLSVDKAAGAKCSAFASFGSWSKTLP